MFRRSDSPTWPRSRNESQWYQVRVPRVERTSRQSSPFRYVKREPSVPPSFLASMGTSRPPGVLPPPTAAPASSVLGRSSGRSETSLSSSDSRSSSRTISSSGSRTRLFARAGHSSSEDPQERAQGTPSRHSTEASPPSSASSLGNFSRSLEDAVRSSHVLRSRPWVLNKYKRCAQENLVPCQPSLCTSTTDMFGEELDFQDACLALPVSSGNQSCYRPEDLARAWTSYAELSLESGRRPSFEVTDPMTGIKYCQDGTTFDDPSTHALVAARTLFRDQALHDRPPQRMSVSGGTQASNRPHLRLPGESQGAGPPPVPEPPATVTPPPSSSLRDSLPHVPPCIQELCRGQRPSCASSSYFQKRLLAKMRADLEAAENCFSDARRRSRSPRR